VGSFGSQGTPLIHWIVAIPRDLVCPVSKNIMKSHFGVFINLSTKYSESAIIEILARPNQARKLLKLIHEAEFRENFDSECASLQCTMTFQSIREHNFL
jgi:hypothetical protein